MSLIIAATDFSDVGENAVNYACSLALNQNASLVIIHSFIIPVMFSDIPMPGSLINDAQNDAEEQMTNLLHDVKRSYPGLQVRGSVIYGDTISAVNDFTDEHKDPWLIIVGNSKTGENTWLDSTLIEVFKKLKYPVLAVPGNIVFRPVSALCFAFDNKHAGNETALHQLNGLVSKLNASLHVLTVHPKAANQDNEGVDENAKQLLAASNPAYQFVNDAADVDQAIQDFTEKNNIDWLIMIPRRHSFFEGLFHKSHTKAIAHNSAIPILALHDNNA